MKVSGSSGFLSAHNFTNILVTVESQCHWLHQIGFQEVHCDLKTLDPSLVAINRPKDHQGC